MIFVVIGLFSFTIEMLVWWQISSESAKSSHWLRRTSFEDPIGSFGEGLDRRLSRSQNGRWRHVASKKLRQALDWWSNLSFRRRIEALVLRPIDCINTVWLCYIVLAQTFGWYRTCECQASVWGGGGGYIDFQTIQWYRAHGVAYYWGA